MIATKVIGKAGACRTTQCQAKLALDISEAFAAAPPRLNYRGQTFGEDPTWTIGVRAAEPAS